MKVFVTGATGFIGTAIVAELRAHGHEVLGLARSETSAETLRKLGVAVHRGDLGDPASLLAAAEACDGVIHTAFIHDFTQMAASSATDRRAITALLDALAGTHKPFVSTSGTAMLASGQLGTEDQTPPAGPLAMRAEAEAFVLAGAERGVRTSLVRLPPSVHGAGDHGFVPALIGFARRAGVSTYIDDGQNRWPAVHRDDAARLYRLALENAPAGSKLHGVAESGIPFRQIAEAIATGLGVHAQGLPVDEAAAHLEWMAHFAAVDNPMSSARTQELLGWKPAGLDLLADIRESGYFA